MKRRTFLFGGVAAVASVAGYSYAFFRLTDMPGLDETSQKVSQNTAFEIAKSEDEWRRILSDAQYRILREEGTERPFSSSLNSEKRNGIFHCAGCDLPVYSSEAKYDSGTGWPSFYQSLPDAVATKEDTSLFVSRTEVHCRRCGGHFGHIFDDGPEPTGMRHCLNGLALDFKPQAAA
jgi:peptide-methionine (R)-S-oxide reductase